MSLFLELETSSLFLPSLQIYLRYHQDYGGCLCFCLFIHDLLIGHCVIRIHLDSRIGTGHHFHLARFGTALTFEFKACKHCFSLHNFCNLIDFFSYRSKMTRYCKQTVNILQQFSTAQLNLITSISSSTSQQRQRFKFDQNYCLCTTIIQL